MGEGVVLGASYSPAFTLLSRIRAVDGGNRSATAIIPLRVDERL